MSAAYQFTKTTSETGVQMRVQRSWRGENGSKRQRGEIEADENNMKSRGRAG